MSIVISPQAQAIFDKIQAMRESAAVTVPPVSAVTDVQLDAWKKMPKEQALKEALTLFKSEGLDVSETRLKLEILKFISELQGALQPVIPQSMHVVAIEIITPGQKPEQKIINITP
jgi:hypothetical protein